MQILVTGGAGFIGSHLTRALLQDGHRVRILDDFSSGFEANLDGVSAEILRGDVRDRAEVAHAMRAADWVFHLGAFVSVPASLDDPLTAYDVNLQGSLNVLWEAKRAGVERVVLASSAAVYGQTDEIVSEDAELKPISPYAASKLAMEGAAKAFGIAYDLETVCLRFFNVYGPRQSPDSPYAAVIPLFIQALIWGEGMTIEGDGEQRRDFVYVEDVVRACQLAVSEPELAGRVYNIGGGRSTSILELVQTLQQLYPETPPPSYAAARPGDIRHSQANITEARRALGYRPTIDLKQGLGNTIQWFEAQLRRGEV